MTDKKKNEARAKEIFDAYRDKHTVYFASDGAAFFNESDRNNHSNTLADKDKHKVEREDVYPSPGETDFEDDEDTDFLSDEELEAKKAAEDKAKADKKAAEDKAKADKKAAEDKAKADKKAAEDKAKADKKAADDKAKADKKTKPAGTDENQA